MPAVTGEVASLVAEVAKACDGQCGGLHDPQIEAIVDRECQNASHRALAAFRADVRAAMGSKPVPYAKAKASK